MIGRRRPNRPLSSTCEVGVYDVGPGHSAELRVGVNERAGRKARPANESGSEQNEGDNQFPAHVRTSERDAAHRTSRAPVGFAPQPGRVFTRS